MPTVFISYSWDSPEHKNWVRALADRLLAKGIETVLDQYDCPPGTNFLHFMEQAVEHADRVLIVLTENYKTKADGRAKGVGYENTILSAELYDDGLSAKCIPLLRQGDYASATPIFLKGRVPLDFRDDALFDAQLEQLLKAVYNHSDKPLPGPKPDFSAPTPAAAPTPVLPEPVFPKLDLKTLDFSQALRPAQTKAVAARLPASLNILADKGQGRRRFLDDLARCGLATGPLRLVQLQLPLFLTDYPAFLREVARQAGAEAGGRDLVDLLRQGAALSQKPLLFILENLETLFDDLPDMDPAFGLSFLAKLNALKTCAFAELLVSSRQSVSHAVFRGVSSPLTLEEIRLHPLSHEDIRNEAARRLPGAPAELHGFIAEQLEFDPTRTGELLQALLLELEGRAIASRDAVGQTLRALRRQFAGKA